MRHRAWTQASLVCLALCAALIAPAVRAQDAPPPTGHDITPDLPALLLVNPEITPHVEMSWETASGERVVFAGERPYGADADRTTLGENVSCYVGVGGSRLLKGAGHPRGAIIRVGFYKLAGAKAFFRDLPAGGVVEVRLSNIAFNQPVKPQPNSPVQHLKYSTEDLESCGLPGSARDQFTTVDPEETLNDRIRPGEDTRAGGLSGEPGSLGSVELTREDDGTISMVARFSYPTLRHMSDPWQSDLPGTFLEPIHFHIEFEVLPEGVEPLDLEAMRARTEALRSRIESETPVVTTGVGGSDQNDPSKNEGGED
ncbi:MAG: hypothetical protein DHS20C14_15210 [Phycisphaeraceae bacterium]|nr:MAG: hypothetical protein DHS20C14_15210 [Phycisphaeraceae bacterium]